MGKNLGYVRLLTHGNIGVASMWYPVLDIRRKFEGMSDEGKAREYHMEFVVFYNNTETCVLEDDVLDWAMEGVEHLVMLKGYLRPGDKVVVADKPNKTWGEFPYFVSGMKKHCGKTVEIKETYMGKPICDGNCSPYIIVEDDRWIWPANYFTRLADV